MRRMWAVAKGSVLFLIFAAIGAVLLFPVRQQTREIDKDLIDARVETVQGSATGLRVMIQTAKGEAQALADSLQPWTGSNRQIADTRAKLETVAGKSVIFDSGIYVSSPDGIVIATSNGVAALQGLRRPASFLQPAVSKALITPVFQDPLIKIPVFGVASPLKDASGRTTAILIAMAQSKSPSIRALQESLPFNERAQAFIVDPEGKVLDPSLPEGVDASNRAVLDLRTRIGSRPSGSSSFNGPGGIEQIGAWASADDGWTVVAYQAKRDLLKNAKGPERSAAIAAAALVLLASLAISLLLIRISFARKEADRVKRAFLAIAGHELRTPLTAIRGFSQTLEGRWEKLGDDQRKQMLSTIARQARNLENLIERLLLGAQLEGGIKQSPSLRELDVTEAVEKAVRHQQAQAPLHDFDVRLEPGLTAKADTKGLNQVLTQLLENAVKYSPSGGTVTITGKKISGGVEIAVEDQGVGLPSDLSGIFDKFGQGESVDTRVHDEGGVGLGLFIARQHLELMNGTIKAERGKPGGARFVVRLRA